MAILGVDDTREVQRLKTIEQPKPQHPVQTTPAQLSDSVRNEHNFRGSLIKSQLQRAWPPACDARDNQTSTEQFSQATALASHTPAGPPGGSGEAPITIDGPAAAADNGTEAAQRLLNTKNYDVPAKFREAGDRERARSADFIATLEKHQHDPKFLKDIFDELGGEKSVELLSEVSIYHGKDQATAESVARALSESYDAMSDAQQKSYQDSFIQRATADFNAARGVSTFLQSHHAPPELKTAFVDAVLAKQPSDNIERRLYAQAALAVMPKGAEGFVSRADYARVARLDPTLNFPNFTGVGQKDAELLAQWLTGRDPQAQAEMLHQYLTYPASGATLKFTAALAQQPQQTLADALAALYDRNPQATLQKLHEISHQKDGLPLGQYGDQSGGLDQIIAKTSRPGLITAYAFQELATAKQGPDHAAHAVNAMTALGGLSPSDLQKLLANHKAEIATMIETVGKFLGSPANNAGFLNPWSFNPALGDLLKKASQFTGPDGKITPEALELFEMAVPHLGDNIFSMEGAGAFFIEHGTELVNYLTSPEKRANGGLDTLQTFFKGILFSPLTNILKYQNGSLTEALLGKREAGGNFQTQGAIWTVMQNLTAPLTDLKRTPDGQLTDASQKKLSNIGDQMGYLLGTVEAALLQTKKEVRLSKEEAKEQQAMFAAFAAVGVGMLAATAAGAAPITIIVAGTAVKVGGLDKPFQQAAQEIFKAMGDFPEDGSGNPSRILNRQMSSILDQLEDKLHLSGDMETAFKASLTETVVDYLPDAF